VFQQGRRPIGRGVGGGDGAIGVAQTVAFEEVLAWVWWPQVTPLAARKSNGLRAGQILGLQQRRSRLGPIRQRDRRQPWAVGRTTRGRTDRVEPCHVGHLPSIDSSAR
jgi:hypothetical protein